MLACLPGQTTYCLLDIHFIRKTCNTCIRTFSQNWEYVITFRVTCLWLLKSNVVQLCGTCSGYPQLVSFLDGSTLYITCRQKLSSIKGIVKVVFLPISESDWSSSISCWSCKQQVEGGCSQREQTTHQENVVGIAKVHFYTTIACIAFVCGEGLSNCQPQPCH